LLEHNTSRLLLNDDKFILIYEKLAEMFGLDKAVFIQRIHFWLNTESGRVVDGRRWIYNSYPEWAKQMPWWSERSIRRIIVSLEDDGILVSSQLDKELRNMVKWYTIDYERLRQITG